LGGNRERSYRRGPPLSLRCSGVGLGAVLGEGELGGGGEVKVSAAWLGFSVAITPYLFYVLRVADRSFN
jgi:hypothetical protein